MGDAVTRDCTDNVSSLIIINWTSLCRRCLKKNNKQLVFVYLHDVYNEFFVTRFIKYLFILTNNRMAFIQ